MAFFSVIIPTLNEEGFLPKLLTDLTKQKDKDFEVIVVDACSEDTTIKKAKKFSALLDLRTVQSLKKNVCSQRNLGAKESKGKYLIFIDADSRVNSSFISSIKKAITTQKGLVFIPYTTPQEKSTSAHMLFNMMNVFVDISQTIGKPFSTGGSMIWEKNTFLTLGGFDEKIYIAEDHAIIQKAQKWGIKAKFISSIKIKFSLRRMKKEGTLKLLYKYTLATAHLYLKGDIKNKIFDYQMGGKEYAELNSSISIDERIKNYFKELLKQLG